MCPLGVGYILDGIFYKHELYADFYLSNYYINPMLVTYKFGNFDHTKPLLVFLIDEIMTSLSPNY